MNDTLYHRFQPVTWGVGVVDAPAEKVADAVAYADPRSARRAPSKQAFDSAEDALQAMEPLTTPGRLLVLATRDGRAALFGNIIAFQTVTEYATWTVAEIHDVRAYFVLRIPTTIARDQMSGTWGANQLSVRDPENMKTVQDPTFYISVLNDCGRWVFDRCGQPQPFEEQEAYKARRRKDRFTNEMLLRYCDALGIPVYDSSWYTKEAYMVSMQSFKGAPGLTYQEAAVNLRIPEGKGKR